MGELYIKNVDLDELEQHRLMLDSVFYKSDSRFTCESISEATLALDYILDLLRNWSELRRFRKLNSEKYLAQLISPDIPMTTNQAEARYECELCQIGIGCSYNCVESSTGSTRCPTCNGRVWFNRDTPARGTLFMCPYCENNI